MTHIWAKSISIWRSYEPKSEILIFPCIHTGVLWIVPFGSDIRFMWPLTQVPRGLDPPCLECSHACARSASWCGSTPPGSVTSPLGTVAVMSSCPPCKIKVFRFKSPSLMRRSPHTWPRPTTRCTAALTWWTCPWRRSGRPMAPWRACHGSWTLRRFGRPPPRWWEIHAIWFIRNTVKFNTVMFLRQI